MTSIDPSINVLEYADTVRQNIRKKLLKQNVLEQYFSNAPLARLMASMMTYSQKNISILDPGAGVGSLFAACVTQICNKRSLPDSIAITAYEIDNTLSHDLNGLFDKINEICNVLGIDFTCKLYKKDFINEYARGAISDRFTHAILNPPYKKINTISDMYAALRNVGLQTTNMYTAFIAISHNLLSNGGQMTFISPRSFCNGMYFYPFRSKFLESMSLRRIHLFDSRSSSFSDDGVLQENVIIHAKKNGTHRDLVISSSHSPKDNPIQRHVKSSDVVFDDDPLQFIHIVTHESEKNISQMINSLECTLEDLNMGVSTGKVVDFRMTSDLRFVAEENTVPLVMPLNIAQNKVRFPVKSKKHHNFIIANTRSKKHLIENGNYVLVKRFTAREEKKRIVAAVWTRTKYNSDLVGFDNKINYFHKDCGSLETNIARGLCAFLNSTVVDTYFRQFNGSTQVNATDLRYLRYPSARQLGKIGRKAGDMCDQNTIDNVVDVLFNE